jgi:hypothetical protein
MANECCDLVNIPIFGACDPIAEDNWMRFIFAKKTAAEILLTALASSVAITARLTSLEDDPNHYIITPALIMGSDFNMEEATLQTSTNTPDGSTLSIGFNNPRVINIKLDRLSPEMAEALLNLNCVGELQIIAIDNANNLIGRFGSNPLYFRGFYGKALVSKPSAVKVGDAHFTRMSNMSFTMTEENWFVGANYAKIKTTYALGLA